MPRASTRKGTLAQHNQGGFAGAGQGRAFLLPVPGAESSSTRPFGKIAPSIGATGDDAAISSSEETGGAGYGKALRTLWERLKEHPLARVGPGLITCVVDDDPSDIATYSHGSPVQVQHALDDPAFIPADGRGPIHVRADRSRDWPPTSNKLFRPWCFRSDGTRFRSLFGSIAKAGEDAAEAQLSIHYGHIALPFLLTYAMTRSWERLEPWLGYRI